MKPTRFLVVVATLFATTALVAIAKTDVVPGQATVSEAAARRTALALVPQGTAKSAELEQEHGKLIWSIDVTAPDTDNITEIAVDAHTGKVITTHIETPASEAAERAAESAEKK